LHLIVFVISRGLLYDFLKFFASKFNGVDEKSGTLLPFMVCSSKYNAGAASYGNGCQKKQ
jgi:hypothetical protein